MHRYGAPPVPRSHTDLAASRCPMPLCVALIIKNKP
jgi:hypothetical protein